MKTLTPQQQQWRADALAVQAKIKATEDEIQRTREKIARLTKESDRELLPMVFDWTTTQYADFVLWNRAGGIGRPPCGCSECGREYALVTSEVYSPPVIDSGV